MQRESFLLILTHFSSVSHFYTPWKRQKTKGFLMFSGDIENQRFSDVFRGVEMWHWTKMS